MSEQKAADEPEAKEQFLRKASEPAPCIQSAVVTLPVFEWHCLLKSLEFNMAFVNRDSSDAKRLYENIASQLAQCRVKVGD